MAHFAKISNEKRVLNVVAVDNSNILNNDGIEDEAVGQAYLEQHGNWPAEMWIKTSYNTRGGKYYNQDGSLHSDQSRAFRGNHAGIGDTWNEDDQIFWPEKPYGSWTKNFTTANWDSPIDYPSEIDDGLDKPVWTWNILWNENVYLSDNTKGWKGTKSNIDGTSHSDTQTYDWNGSSWVVEP